MKKTNKETYTLFLTNPRNTVLRILERCLFSFQIIFGRDLDIIVAAFYAYDWHITSLFHNLCVIGRLNIKICGLFITGNDQPGIESLRGLSHPQLFALQGLLYDTFFYDLHGLFGRDHEQAGWILFQCIKQRIQVFLLTQGRAPS